MFRCYRLLEAFTEEHSRFPILRIFLAILVSLEMFLSHKSRIHWMLQPRQRYPRILSKVLGWISSRLMLSLLAERYNLRNSPSVVWWGIYGSTWINRTNGEHYTGVFFARYDEDVHSGYYQEGFGKTLCLDSSRVAPIANEMLPASMPVSYFIRIAWGITGRIFVWKANNAIMESGHEAFRDKSNNGEGLEPTPQNSYTAGIINFESSRTVPVDKEERPGAIASSLLLRIRWEAFTVRYPYGSWIQLLAKGLFMTLIIMVEV